MKCKFAVTSCEFCNYLYVRAFDSYSNTCLEGTNYAVKYSENRVDPSMTSAKSTKVMVDQDNDKAVIIAKAVSDSFYKKRLDSQTESSNNITLAAECQLQKEMKEVENYISHRVDERTWWVLRSTPQVHCKSIIPVFSRVRVVTIDANGKMRCSCGYTHRHGIPDRHIAHIAFKFGKDFHCFGHHDVDLRYLNSYCNFVATDDPSTMDDSKLSLRSQLQLARREICGFPTAPPFLDMAICMYAVGDNSDDKFKGFTHVQAKDYFQAMMQKGTVVLNYSPHQVQLALKAANFVENAAGLTQETYNCEDSAAEDERIDFPDVDESEMASSDNTHLSPYEQMKPIFAEVISLMDGANEEMINKMKSIGQGMIHELKQFHPSQLPQPKGRLVSCMPPNQLKQKQHHR
jgi:hypothetical protein